MRSKREHIKSTEARMICIPVDPPRGDAIQQFDALELPIVKITENYRTGFLWRLMRSSPYIIEGLLRAGFKGAWLGSAS